MKDTAVGKPLCLFVVQSNFNFNAYCFKQYEKSLFSYQRSFFLNDAHDLSAAVFAGVTAFLAAFVGLVWPLARPERMARASGCCQRVDAWE